MDNNLHIETLLANTPSVDGSGIAPVTGAIYQTSSFINNGKTPYSYTRCDNPTRSALEEKMRVLDGGVRAFAFASGLAAVTACFSLLQSGDESFEHFDLTLYDESARPKMERVFQVCRTFAQTFRPGTMNLLLQGGTGLGKTYLSACIARVVAGAGYAVAYETAASALDAFECAKFQRSSADGEAAAQRVEQYLGCDLMILDDLGTEMITAYSTSALYTLINTRLTRKKATIISTNCSNEELQKKYTPQILSRIAGEYQTLPFAGRDIRQIKKEREA